jgi:hypothetical protein
MLTPNLLAWQLAHYAQGHQDRTNLLLHALTAPFAILGTAAFGAYLATGHVGRALAGLAVVALVFALQGRGHKREANGPLPFRSPLDVVVRLFAEQLVTFPRFVLSGGFARAWRAARA